MSVTNYIWDGQQYLMETDDSNTTTAAYTNEPDQYTNLISQHRHSATQYAGFDGLGSTRQLTNSSETVIDKWKYDAWGNIVSHTGSTEFPFQFVGRFGYYFDSETDAAYVIHRIYQPENGRWWSMDPLSFVDGLNEFQYVLNQIVQSIDPSGQERWVCCTFWNINSSPYIRTRFIHKRVMAWGLATLFSSEGICSRYGNPPSSSYTVFSAKDLCDGSGPCPNFGSDFYVAQRPAETEGLTPFQKRFCEICNTQHVDVASVDYGFIRRGYSGSGASGTSPKYRNLDGGSKKTFRPTKSDIKLSQNDSCDKRLWGTNIKCRHATAANIKNCLEKFPYPPPPYDDCENNCQTDVSDATSACCLQGAENLPGAFCRSGSRTLRDIGRAPYLPY